MNPERSFQPPEYLEINDPKQRELLEFVRTVDLGEVASLLQSRISTEKNAEIDLVPPERIFSKYVSGRVGRYILRPREIDFSLEDALRLAERLGVDEKFLKTHYLIHEQIHAASDTGCSDETLLTRSFQVGSAKTTQIKGIGLTISGLCRLWDEGITEKLSREVFASYAVKTGMAKQKEIDDYFTTIKKHTGQKRDCYSSEVKLVDAFIGRIAEETSLDPETIWNSLVDSFLTGTQFDDQEICKFAKEVLPENFLEDLKAASSHSTVERLTRELHRGKTNSFKSSSFIRKMRRMAEDYLESMGRTVS